MTEGGPVDAGLHVDVLGPLRLRIGDGDSDVRGPKRRAVLALLAIADGRAVTDDALLDALWPDEIPDSGRAALHSHVSRLRGHLGIAGDRLERLDGAYRLRLDPDGLDLARARAAMTAARRLLPGDPGGAHDLTRQALGLWRGPVLAEFAEVAPLAACAQACAEFRRDLLDLGLAAALAAGRLDGLVAEASAALAEDPFREPTLLLLMQAQARLGQAPAALDTARSFRARLGEETGLDPSPALAALERAVAAGDLAPAAARVAPIPAEVPRSAPRSGPKASDFTAPPAVHRLVGRDEEVADLVARLRTERLVTLIGPGGVGKTRLAQAVRDEVDAVGFVALAPVTEAGGIPAALATALDVRGHHPDLLAACVAVLAARPAVLVVDNCEHLIEPVRDGIAALLAGCPDLHVLATSRAPIGLAAEARYRVGPLALPAAGRPVREAAAVEVFLDRAARVRPGFEPAAADLPLIADIVRRLDGMPLAIELAAGRLATFSLLDLHDRLDRALDLLGDGRPSADARHRTLRDTVQWSYTLLPEPEQRLFRHLSAFADGVTLDTAELIAAGLALTGDPATALAHLVDASMVEVTFASSTSSGQARYRMLETLRAFGLDRLAAAGEDAEAADRVIRWAVDLAAAIDDHGHSDREPEADATLRREVLNLRAAFLLARERGRLDDASAMVVSLNDARSWRDLTQLTGWAEELLAAGFPPDHPAALGVHAAASMDAYMRGDHAAADRIGQAGLGLGGGGDARRFLLVALSSAALTRADWDTALAYDLEAEKHATRPSSSPAVGALGALYGGDPVLARELCARTLERAPSPSIRAFALYVDGEISSMAGELAEHRYTDAIALAREAGATFVVGVASVGLLAALTRAGRVSEALAGYRDVVEYWGRAGNWTHQWVTLRNLADLLDALDDPASAAVLRAAAARDPDAPPGPAPTGDLPVDADLSRAGALATARTALAQHLEN